MYEGAKDEEEEEDFYDSLEQHVGEEGEEAAATAAQGQAALSVALVAPHPHPQFLCHWKTLLTVLITQLAHLSIHYKHNWSRVADQF